jgi:hypothetical protein
MEQYANVKTCLCDLANDALFQHVLPGNLPFARHFVLADRQARTDASPAPILPPANRPALIE